MPSLRDLQLGLLDYLRTGRPEPVAAAVRPAGLAPERRLQIHRNNVLGSLRQALTDCFPAILALVGDEFFAYLAYDYAVHHPPAEANLNRYGAGFPDFLGNHARLAELPYLRDVAALEWARQEAYHAADRPSAVLGRLAATDADRFGELVFLLHPSVRLLRSVYPALRIWEVNQPGHEGDQAVNLDEGPSRTLVARLEAGIVCVALSAGEFLLLSEIAAGRPFQAASDAALAAQPRFQLAESLQRWIGLGVIVDFS